MQTLKRGSAGTPEFPGPDDERFWAAWDPEWRIALPPLKPGLGW